MTLRKISDKDMEHCLFLKSTCDIGGPSLRAPGFEFRGVAHVCTLPSNSRHFLSAGTTLNEFRKQLQPSPARTNLHLLRFDTAGQRLDMDPHLIPSTPVSAIGNLRTATLVNRRNMGTWFVWKQNCNKSCILTKPLERYGAWETPSI